MAYSLFIHQHTRQRTAAKYIRIPASAPKEPAHPFIAEVSKKTCNIVDHRLSIEEAYLIVNQCVRSADERLHLKQMAAIMKAWSMEREAADHQTALQWELAGLFLDTGPEIAPADHCARVVKKLEEAKANPDISHSLFSAGLSFPGNLSIEKMCTLRDILDVLSAFIHNKALENPDYYEGINVQSILKGLAATPLQGRIFSEDLDYAVAVLNTSLEEIIQFIIDHQKDLE